MKWIRNPKQQQAEEINRYIDDPNQAAGLDEETRQVLDSVRQSAEEIQPSPPFVNQLSARLQTAAQTPPSRRTRMARFLGHWTPRLAGAGLTLALVALLFIWLSSWLPDVLPLQVELEPAADFDNVVAGQSLAFPDVPEQLPLYQVTTQPIPDTPETAVAWAAAFGLPDPEPFLSPAAENIIFVIGSDGQELTFHPGPLSMISYNSGVTMAELTGEPPSLEVATAAAVAFLADRELLPPVYQVTDQGAMTRASPVRTVNVDIELAGQRMDSSMPYGTTLTVGPDGRIINANFGLLEFVPLEEYVSVQPAEAAYEAFREGRATLFRTDSRIEESNHSRTFMPPLPAYEVGDDVTLTGWVNILVSPDGQTVRATLRDGVTAAQYTLVGESVAELVEEVTVRTSVQVVGRIVAQDGPGRWQVAVAEWQSEIISFVPPLCLVGTFDRADGEGWLLLDEADNGRHLIPQSPDELTSGERIEICLRAEDERETVDEINWLHIASPPYSELLQPAAGTMSMQQVEVVREVVTTMETDGSSTSVTEHLVEVGPADVEPPDLLPTRVPMTAEGSGMAAVSVPILPESPYELGQSVVITGIVQGHFTADYQGQLNRIDVRLLVDPLWYSLPILADDALLDELLTDHYWRFVTLTGTIVDAPPDQPASNNRAIELESYRPAWPEVVPRNFLGHISLENFDGTQALVFTDRETAQQYILSWDIPAEAFTHMVGRGEQQLVSGLVDPTRELAGLPFMYQMGSRSGSDIETAETADQFPVEIEAPVHRQAPDYISRPGQADMVIERMELIYYYEPQYEQSSMGMGQPPQLGGKQIARPVWLIVARSPDGLTQLRYYLEAHQR